jgi:hypothetical protein
MEAPTSALEGLAGRQVTVDSDSLGVNQEALYLDTGTEWDDNTISVCWSTSGLSSTKKGYVKDIVESQWEKYSHVDFTGWGDCGAGTADVTITVEDNWLSGPHTLGLGQGSDVFLNFTFLSWNEVEDANGNLRPCSTTANRDCIEVVALHEFGHVLGFLHENERSDGPPPYDGAGSCNLSAFGGTELGDWDYDSIMNYCNQGRGVQETLSEGDIFGLRRTYSLGYLRLSGDAPAVTTANLETSDSKDEIVVAAEDDSGDVAVLIYDTDLENVNPRNRFDWPHDPYTTGTQRLADLRLSDATDPSVAVGNFDGDAALEVAVAVIDSLNRVAVLIYDVTSPSPGTLAFGASRVADLRLASTTRPDLAAADLNGDGRDEVILAACDSSGQVAVLIYDSVSSGTTPPRTLVREGDLRFADSLDPSIDAGNFALSANSELVLARINPDGDAELDLLDVTYASSAGFDYTIGGVSGTPSETVIVDGAEPSVGVSNYSGDSYDDAIFYVTDTNGRAAALHYTFSYPSSVATFTRDDSRTYRVSGMSECAVAGGNFLTGGRDDSVLACVEPGGNIGLDVREIAD